MRGALTALGGGLNAVEAAGCEVARGQREVQRAAVTETHPEAAVGLDLQQQPPVQSETVEVQRETGGQRRASCTAARAAVEFWRGRLGLCCAL